MIAHQVHLLAGNEKMGFFGNMTDAVATVSGAGKHDTLEPGEHRFDVVVSIPDDAPATHVGGKTRVFDELSVRVDVPAGRDLKDMRSLQVAPVAVDYTTAPVRTRYPDDAGRGLIDSLFGPDVRVEMALAADKYRRDELIEGIVTIEAQQPVNSFRCSWTFPGPKTRRSARPPSCWNERDPELLPGLGRLVGSPSA